MSQRHSTSSVSLASYESVDIGCCFPHKKPAQFAAAKEGSQGSQGSQRAPSSLAPTELKEEDNRASPSQNSDNVTRRFSTKRREIVEQGHDCLRQASDLIYQHRNSLGQISQELEDRWAQLFHVAPVAQKLTKGRQQPKEFYENAQKLLQDVEEELRKAEERKQGAPSKPSRFSIPKYAASIRSVARSVRSQLSKITNRRQMGAPFRPEETSLLASQNDANDRYRAPYYPEDGVASLRPTSRVPPSNLEQRRNQSTRYPPMSVHSAQLGNSPSADRALPQTTFTHDEQSVHPVVDAPDNVAARVAVPSVYTQQIGSHPAFTGHVPSDARDTEKERRPRRDDRDRNYDYDSGRRGYYSSSRDRDKYRPEDYHRSSRDDKYRDRVKYRPEDYHRSSRDDKHRDRYRDRDRDRDYERSSRRHRSSQDRDYRDRYDDRRYRSSRDQRSRDKDHYQDRYKDRYEDRYKDRDRDRDKYERDRHRSDDRQRSRSGHDSQTPAAVPAAENEIQATHQDPVIADESSPGRFQEVFTDAGTVRE